MQALGQDTEEPLHTQEPHEGLLPALPDATGLHVPSLPPKLQASQEPPHAVLQQKPSTQVPLMHWADTVQAPPLGFWLVH